MVQAEQAVLLGQVVLEALEAKEETEAVLNLLVLTEIQEILVIKVVQTKKGADTIVVVDQERQALVEDPQAAVVVRLLVT
tara:strand:- start:55 stop:294 length:240 start_codon:yes stop_codon:yes gene_type:complete